MQVTGTSQGQGEQEVLTWVRKGLPRGREYLITCQGQDLKSLSPVCLAPSLPIAPSPSGCPQMDSSHF